MREMIARNAQAGRIDWIGVRGARREPLVARPGAQILHAGLEGDHARPGKRAVTLIQAEHLPAIAAYLGRSEVRADELRRNILVSGLNLAALKGRALQIGDACLRITTICAPCSRMEETFGPGGYSAVRGHGGWCAEVLEPGRIVLGDAVLPLAEDCLPPNLRVSPDP